MQELFYGELESKFLTFVLTDLCDTLNYRIVIKILRFSS